MFDSYIEEQLKRVRVTLGYVMSVASDSRFYPLKQHIINLYNYQAGVIKDVKWERTPPHFSEWPEEQKLNYHKKGLESEVDRLLRVESKLLHVAIP